MSISVHEVIGRKDRRRFVDVQYRLFEGNPYWVPPLRRNEQAAFDTRKNPAFEFCDVARWLAVRDGKSVGRIAGIVDRRSNETWNEQVARFSWIDFVDDPKVARVLLETVESWAHGHEMEAVRGPMQFTSFDASGLLVEGFDELSTFGSGYHHPYYAGHIEACGYEKEADYLEYQVTLTDSIPEKIERLSRVVAERNNLHVLDAQSRADITPFTREIFNVINEAYRPLYGFVQLTERQIDQYIEKYFSFVVPDFLPIVLDETDRIVAFGVTMPSLSRAAQRCNGRLFPFGFRHFKRALKVNRFADLYLTAVRPDMQNKGVNAMLIHHMNRVFLERGVEIVETNRELESNSKIQAQWKYYDARQHKRRRVYRKNL